MTRQRSRFDLMRREDRSAHVMKEFARLARKWPGQPVMLIVVAHEGAEEGQEFVHMLGSRGEEYLLKLVASKATRAMGAMKVTELVAAAIQENKRKVLVPGADA